MTLQTFLQLTATTPEPALRRALASALSAERPTSREDYVRFYHRVLGALCSTRCTDSAPFGASASGRQRRSPGIANRAAVVGRGDQPTGGADISLEALVA